ncbi:MAG TPA: arsinothricin resistance N-acetyltransferase ArsN1 family A, partial [Solirubrobacteraceae bacterium]|nr:arsinothricin resistance N-acetyltransferase ArsN1 family A [Solirubrobacteraceae bacterium]
MTAAVIRPASPQDAGRIAAVYSAGIAERQATFETEPRTAHDVAPWLAADGQPLLVAESGGEVAGWARVMRSSDRCAYAGVGEYTIYLDPAVRGRGIGQALLAALAQEAEAAGYWKLLGRLFTTNGASIALAHRAGFDDVGVHRRHGRLEGEWKDVLVVE